MDPDETLPPRASVETRTVDVLVVGAGPAGLAAARSLASRKLSVLVVDEHDQNSRAKLDASVVQLRRQLDRLAEGHLPGSFVLYLTLDDFAERLQDHEAVRQRLEPILGRETPSRLLVRLDSVRDRHGHEFLAHAGEKLYGLLTGEAMPSTFAPQLSALAKRHDRLGGCSTRDFVKELAQAIDV